MFLNVITKQQQGFDPNYILYIKIGILLLSSALHACTKMIRFVTTITRLNFSLLLFLLLVSSPLYLYHCFEHMLALTVPLNTAQ